MTQSSSVSTAAQAVAAIGNSKRNAAENEEISLQELIQQNKASKEGMKPTKKIDDDDIKFDF